MPGMSSSRHPAAIPTRLLGRTGRSVTLFALGGEGVLRTHGRAKEAAAVIERALDCGVNYCDTAPAYSSSMDYYGAVLGERREEIFLASKTADCKFELFSSKFHKITSKIWGFLASLLEILASK